MIKFGMKAAHSAGMFPVMIPDIIKTKDEIKKSSCTERQRILLKL